MPANAERDPRRETSNQPKHRGASTTQWVIGVFSSILVLALLGFLVYEALTGNGQPPLITVSVDQVLVVPGGYQVRVSARNAGAETAKALHIEGTLKQDTTTIETSTATIDYVPADATRRAGLFFTRDPRRHTLELRPVGYDTP